jgi:hypothetical protein
VAPIQPPAYQQANTYPARLDRLALASMMTPAPGGGSLAPRGGVQPTPANSGLGVTQRVTPAMFVTVGAGTAYVPASSATGGLYAVCNDAAYDVAIATAHATLGRKDLVVARVYDAEYSGAANNWALEAVTGTPAGSPVVPSTPAGALLLAVIQVNAATTTIVNGNITDSRTYTTALGGMIPALSTARPPNPYEGMGIYETNNNLPKWYDGASWKGWQDEGYQTAAGLTAALNAAGIYAPQYVIKTADQSRTSSTTMVADSELALPMVANGLYWMEGLAIYDADTAGDILIGWSGPSGTTMQWYSDLLDVGGGAGGVGVGSVGRSAQSLSGTPSGGGRGSGTSNLLAAPFQGYVQTAASSGNLQLRFAQATSSAVATTMRTGSLLILRRLA